MLDVADILFCSSSVSVPIAPCFYFSLLTLALTLLLVLSSVLLQMASHTSLHVASYHFSQNLSYCFLSLLSSLQKLFCIFIHMACSQSDSLLQRLVSASRCPHMPWCDGV